MKNLAEANFSDSKLFLANLTEAVLTGANFQEADLTSASFSSAKLEKADFRKSIVLRTGFQGADLSGANFEGVDLNNVSFQNCVMKGANLRNALKIGDVQKTDLRNADLRGASFTCTVYYMTGCRLSGALYDKNTRWPAGFDVAASGAVLKESAPADKPSSSGAKTSGGSKSTTPAKPPALDGETLTEDVVKYLLETRLWGAADGSISFRYVSLKLAPPRKGDARIDGTPANREVQVTPVRVQVQLITDLKNNDSRTEEKRQDFVFFRDEFGEWTYRFQANP